ncbi:putative pentatricopeptide repeat-containing protein At1g56570 [Musa acuminata AAA Group]|uniref:putative pentatricopeptide repeat-containing protein At1g56570 n=1 Tax=Musa acuminata AAA Group TaxID=214697 RepID=UPI0031DC0778
MCHAALLKASAFALKHCVPSFAARPLSSNPIAEPKAFLIPSTDRWNSMIRAHVNSGHFHTALSLFSAMREGGARPDHYTFPLVNRAASSLANRIDVGEAIHCLAVKAGFAGDVYFCNTMMEAYVRNGGVGMARRVFDEMCMRDVVSWTSLISGHARVGDFDEAFDLLHRMRAEGLQPSPVTLAVLLRACCAAEDVAGGCQLHGFVIKMGFGGHELVQNSILTMFSKLSCLEVAQKLFDDIQNRSVASWNILVSMYSSMGDVSGAIDSYEKMKMEWSPSSETLTSLLSALAKSEDLRLGKWAHCHAVKAGQIDAILHASLVDFYAKCGELEFAVQLYEEAQTKSSTLWCIMLWGFLQNGEFLETVHLFQRMQEAGFMPGKDALRVLVMACSHLGVLMWGKGIHGYLIRNNTLEAGGSDDTALGTSVLNMYAKCGSIDLARRCFDRIAEKDIVAWTSMVEGYAVHGLGMEALDLFYRMKEEGVRPNSVTFLSLLSACSHSGLVREGCELFDCMITRYCIRPEISHYTCLVDLLGRSGRLGEALDVITGMIAEPDGRIWGALLASCRTHSDSVLGKYAAKKVFDLEPDNMGYQVVLSNIFAGDERWEETERTRKLMHREEVRKKPGWSCVQVKGMSDVFVAGDKSHPQVGKIYEVLGCLARQSEESRDC